MASDDKIWFKRKSYGWGWVPASKEGWIVTGIYGLLVFAIAYFSERYVPEGKFPFLFVLLILLLTTVFIAIAYKKGEKPKWQWGRRKDAVN